MRLPKLHPLPIAEKYDEHELLSRVAAGEEQAFERFVTPFFDKLYGFALSITKFAPLAEEVVQDVFLRIWQHRAELPAVNNTEAWIYTIARNLAYNSLRKQLTEPIVISNLDRLFALEPDSAENRLLLSDSKQLIEKAIGELTPQQAVVFKLSKLENLTLDEIAEQLQLSKETVKRHLTLSLKTVREFIRLNSEGMILFYCLCLLGF